MGQSPDCEPEDTAGDDPYMLIYTSGTTGKPKGAVHVHAGFPVKAAQDLAFCFDVQHDDVLFWLTDLGWMMGPWAIAGGLIAGGSVLIYEGTPDFPEPRPPVAGGRAARCDGVGHFADVDPFVDGERR